MIPQSCVNVKVDLSVWMHYTLYMVTKESTQMKVTLDLTPKQAQDLIHLVSSEIERRSDYHDSTESQDRISDIANQLSVAGLDKFWNIK